MPAPVCTILGGTNGSGKSSLFKYLGLPGPFINADVVAREIRPSDPESASLVAGRQVLHMLERVLEAGQDFTYETTLSSRQSISLMQRARDAGYQVGLIFVLLNEPRLNVERVAQRVAEGGHHIEENVVRRRYEQALVRLRDAVQIANGSMIFDNTALSRPVLLVRCAEGKLEVSNLDADEPLHARLASIVGSALGLTPEAVLRNLPA